jgi:hypothetical protein
MADHDTHDHTGVPGVGGSGIEATIFDAKGDIIAASAADTAAKLTAGTNGQILMAASGETTGLDWVDLGVFAAWTPVLTASSSNPTLGSGGTITGRYVQIGKLVIATANIIFGSSGVGAGSGTYQIDLPVNSTGVTFMGSGRVFDSGGSVHGVAAPIVTAADQMLVLYNGAIVTHAVPWTWAANDVINLTISYEAA